MAAVAAARATERYVVVFSVQSMDTCLLTLTVSRNPRAVAPHAISKQAILLRPRPAQMFVAAPGKQRMTCRQGLVRLASASSQTRCNVASVVLKLIC